MTEEKKLKVIFAPGCFDTFDGDQEELDGLMKAIQEMVDDPEALMANSTPVDLDELDDEVLEAISKQIETLDGKIERKLH